MAGNIGKVKIWTPINMGDQTQVDNHRVKAWLQERRDNWLVYRNAHITLASAKVVAPKAGTKLAPSTIAVKGCLSALSERFNHKNQSQNEEAKKAALETIRSYFLSNASSDFDSTIAKCVSGLSANQLQQLRKNSAALLVRWSPVISPRPPSRPSRRQPQVLKDKW
jgi:hypothetical protein